MLNASDSLSNERVKNYDGGEYKLIRFRVIYPSKFLNATIGV